MRILILGAGTIGASIAEFLCQTHRVSVIDRDQEAVDRINETLDVRALCGSAADAVLLFQAGATDADLCLAVTNSDEVNLVGASVAKAMGTRRAIARVYSPNLLDTSTFDYRRHFKLDYLVSLERLAALDLARVVRSPGALSIETFAVADLEMQEIVVQPGAPAIDIPLRELGVGRHVRVGVISRGDKVFIAGPEDAVAVNDRIALVGKREDIDAVKSLFQTEPPRRQGVVIAGGGETGFHLARLLEGPRFNVVLMESDHERCEFLASHLSGVTVVCCDVRSRAALEEERVGSADFFVACTGDDENNILACVEAKELGAQKVAAVVARSDYRYILTKLGVDHVTTPPDVVRSEVEAHLTTGVVIAKKPFAPGSKVLVMELEVLPNTLITQHVLARVGLPRQCLIAALIREDFAILPGADDRIKPGDTVVALVHESAVESFLTFFEPAE